jgi:hypothetical protein
MRDPERSVVRHWKAVWRGKGYGSQPVNVRYQVSMEKPYGHSVIHPIARWVGGRAFVLTPRERMLMIAGFPILSISLWGLS